MHVEHLNGLTPKNMILITLDGDLTPPDDIKKFILKIKNFDIIVGSRFLMKNEKPKW